MNQYRVHFPVLDAAPAFPETVDLVALRAERDRLGKRVDEGIALLQDLARQGGQDSPRYNRCFAEWEKLFAEETRLLEEIDALERGKQTITPHRRSALVDSHRSSKPRDEDNLE